MCQGTRQATDDTGPNVALEAIRARSRAIRRLRNFAVDIGVELPNEMLDRCKDLLEVGDTVSETDLLKLQRDLTKLTVPYSVLNIPLVSTGSIARYRLELLVIGALCLSLIVLASVLASAFNVLHFDKPPLHWKYDVSVMLFGVLLGILGATTYELSHSVGVLSEREHRYYDNVGNYSRLLVGGMLGWLFLMMISWTPTQSLLRLTLTSGPNPKQIIFVISPFLAGYSSSLVLGILSSLADGLRVALGLSK